MTLAIYFEHLEPRTSNIGFPLPLPIPFLFTKNFHFLSGTDTSSGNRLTMFSSSYLPISESQLLQDTQHLTGQFQKSHQATWQAWGLPQRKNSFCPLSLMNISLMMLVRNTGEGNFKKCDRYITFQIFSHLVDTTGKYHLYQDRVKKEKRKSHKTYAFISNVTICRNSLNILIPSNTHFVGSPQCSHIWKEQTCSTVKYTSALTPVISYYFSYAQEKA